VAKLGFLGLGIMGGPMAGKLLAAGHEVALWSKTPGKAEYLAATGKGTVCASPKHVAELATDAVFYCVGDSAMSHDVALGADGLIEGAHPGAVIADCSTVSPAESRILHFAFAAKGVHFLDAPCTGSKPGAEGGTLTFMIGGERSVFERAKPWFEAMGKFFYYCGGPGMGLEAKLTQNLILANIMQAFSEGMVLATKAGIPPELMLDILNNSAAKSGLISFKAPYILDRNFTANFSTKWMHKDVSMALDSGRANNVPLPITALTQQMFQTAISLGMGELDFSSTIQVLEGWAGVEVKGSGGA
jgi:3-hydroxyisobutyrate dehydrogenase-like beta-hydroxyacid dehydrogenase